MATVFVPREIVEGERRVAATPDTVKRLVKQGFSVTVQRGAGQGAHFSDAAYEAAGAVLGSDLRALYGAADVVLKVNPPEHSRELSEHEAALIKPGALLIAFLWLEAEAQLRCARILAERNVTAFALEKVPRITRAQGMDALSSQSNIAGYEAVLLAAAALPKLFPLLMTAAGTIRAAKVVVFGAGVAGLQAIATARRLGAVVEVSDVRRAAKEQVESLGARFIEVEGAEDLEGEGGYAREASEAFLRRQQELVSKHVAAADVVITTALVPGKRAPRLISAELVKRMRPGAVIVDLAVEQGGNCELSVPGKRVVREGVTIIGQRNLPALAPVDASEMIARNLLAVVGNLFEGAALQADLEDEINDAAVVLHRGQVRLPALVEALSRPAERDAVA